MSKVSDKYINPSMTTDSELASAISGKQDVLGFTPENSSNKNQLNGYAGLDSNGKLSSQVVPSSLYSHFSPVLPWEKIGSLSPQNGDIDGVRVEGFSYLESQEIYLTLKIPSYFVSGPIKLLGGLFYTDIDVGNVLFRIQTTLLRSGSVIGTYSNIHTSTNSLISLASLSANSLQAISDLDLTDSNGKINNVTVAAGDILRVRLYRDIANELSSCLSTVNLLINSFELKTYN